MTEFNLTDAKIVLSMTLFLVLISFVFPAVGFSSHDVNASDIPEFNVTKGTFDFVQTVPETPDNPTEGTLRYVDNQQVYQDNRRIWLEGNTDGGYEVTLTNNGSINDPAASLYLNEYNTTGFIDKSSIEMENTTEFDSITHDNYVITFTNVTYANVGQSDMTIRVDWEIQQTRGGASAVSTIPIIGGTLSATANAIGALGEIIGWIGSILFNIGYNFIVGSTNLATVIYNIVTFFTGMGWFLITTYASVISNAPAAYVALFLSIPGLLLSYEFAKLVIILKQQIPVLG